MFGSSLKILVRNLLHRKGYTFINTLGLAIGMAGCGLIGLYIHEEWKVDRFHTNGDRIYRVTTDYTTNTGDEGQITGVGRPLAQTIAREVPEVEKVVPIRRSNFPIKHNNQYFFQKTLYGGEHLLSVFSFPLLEGNAQTALKEPYSLVMKKSVAQKFFGNQPALGKTLVVADSLNFTVTGILSDDISSHIDFDMMLSLSTFYARGGTSTQWFTWDENCYVMLKDKADPKQAEQKISALSMRHNAEQYKNSGYNVTHSLEPVPSVYLYSKLAGINRAAGSGRQLYILGFIGLFILLLACINFINLSTARQAERAKEVGVRKTIGAGYRSLVGYFIAESYVLVVLGGLVAIALIVLALPYFNQHVEKNISASVLWQPGSIMMIIGFLLVTGLMAGWYPALLLARFRPMQTLKGNVVDQNKGSYVRKGLVIVQFAVSLVLIISTMVTMRQLRYMQAQELGFDHEQMLVINTQNAPYQELVKNFTSIKESILSLAPVVSVSAAAGLPGRSGWQGQLVWAADRPSEETQTMEVIPVEHDYVKTLGLKIISGRDYSKDFSTDARHGMLLNEQACKAFGWKPDEAIGKRLSTSGMDSGYVIGVMADFHQHGLQSRIGPIATFIAPYALGYIAVKLKPGDVSSTVQQIEKYWKSKFPGYSFDYFFLDDDFNMQYKAEQRISTTFSLFSLLAVFIACLGLFALATFMAERRKKEVGIRKVLGASVANVTALLSKDFLKLVLFANVIAWPVGWWVMDRWLQDYEYRIGLNWKLFLLAGIGSILIALLTISFQAIKAALANPVKSLRTE
ncbi:MAG TPA: ABC transporter permease [Chitinophagaceae bacterium]|nr:ABC transporter permease [Chitinophagaceae bacterium]